MMEVSGRTNPTNDVAHVVCDPCASTRKTKKADHFCIDCYEFLCTICTDAHRKLKVAKDHELLEPEEMPIRKFPMNTEMICNEHENKPLDYLCKSHDVVCCTACRDLEHAACYIDYIKDLADQFEASEEYLALKRNMTDLLTLALESKSKAEKNITIAKRGYDAILDDIGNFRKEISSILDALEKKVLKKAKAIREEDTLIMSELISGFDALQEEINETKEKLDYFSSFRQKKRLILESRQAKFNLENVREKINDFSKRNRVRETWFCRNENLLESMKSLWKIGSLEEKEHELIRMLHNEAALFFDDDKHDQVPSKTLPDDKILD